MSVVLPETSDEAKSLGLDPQLCMMCGAMFLTNKAVMQELLVQPASTVETLLAAGLLAPTTSSLLMERYVIADPDEQKAFRLKLRDHLKAEAEVQAGVEKHVLGMDLSKRVVPEGCTCSYDTQSDGRYGDRMCPVHGLGRVANFE